MSHHTSVVDGMDDVLDFEMNRGFYDPRPYGAAGTLPNQAVQGRENDAPNAAAQDGQRTLHKWYVTRLSQPDTCTASDGSGGSEDDPPSEIIASQSSGPSETSSAGSKRALEDDPGNILMWYVTDQTRIVTAVTAVWQLS